MDPSCCMAAGDTNKMGLDAEGAPLGRFSSDASRQALDSMGSGVAAAGARPVPTPGGSAPC
jgi:hypothetical protein